MVLLFLLTTAAVCILSGKMPAMLHKVTCYIAICKKRSLSNMLRPKIGQRLKIKHITPVVEISNTPGGTIFAEGISKRSVKLSSH